MARFIFIGMFFFYTIQNVSSQCVLTVKQIGIKGDSLPEIVCANYQEIKPTKINDSTIQIRFCPTEPTYLFVIIDWDNRWISRMWVDQNTKQKDLVINYSTKSATLKNITNWEKLLAKIDSLDAKENYNASFDIASHYIENNSSSYLSLWLFSHCHGIYLTPNKNKLELFNKLSTSFSNYPEYKQMKADLTGRKFPNYGDSFKEFTLEDVNEKQFTSSLINNKIIMLHFWSNNCAPCIKGMDALINYYNSLDTSKIAFISVSLDDDKSKWKRSVTTNKIIWTNLWTENNLYCELCLNYNLTAMPYFVIFNKEKKITFYNEGEDIELLKSKLQEINK